MEYVKNVVNPIQQVAPRSSLRGLREDYGHLTADVVLLEGEVHSGRKPVSCGMTLTKSMFLTQPYKGSLRFTTIQNRDLFSRLVLYQVHPLNKVYELAHTLIDRMKMKNDGRM